MRVRHLGLLAQATSDTAVNEAQDGDGTECNGNDGTGGMMLASDFTGSLKVELGVA